MNTFTSSIVALGMLGTLSGGLQAKNTTPPKNPVEGSIIKLLHLTQKQVCSPQGIIPNNSGLTDYKRIPQKFSLMRDFHMTENETIDFAYKNNLPFYFDLPNKDVVVKFPPGSYIGLGDDTQPVLKVVRKNPTCHNNKRDLIII